MSAREELASLLLPQRIKAVRMRAGLTQEEFAKTIGSDRPRVNTWERGRGGVSEEYGKKIAAFASRLYGEELPNDLFVSGRRTPLEEAASQLAELARVNGEATEALISLLEDQRLVVGQMSQIATDQRLLSEQMTRLLAVLERHEAASEGSGGSY